MAHRIHEPELERLGAAVAAGLGIALRTAIGTPPGVQVLRDPIRLPVVHTEVLEVRLHDGGRPMERATACLRSIVIDTLLENLRSDATAIERSA